MVRFEENNEKTKKQILLFSHHFLQNRTTFIKIEQLSLFLRWPDDEKSAEMNAAERDLNPQKKNSFQFPIVAEKSSFYQIP